MGMREMILVLGAIYFFSMTSLSINRFCVSNTETLIQNEFEYQAVSIAQRLIEEVKTRQFDADLSFPPSSFDSPYSMGHSNIESYPNFNDVDDYNNLNVNINTALGAFNVTVQVCYVAENDPDTRVYVKTFYKRMTVTVNNNYMSHPITLKHVFAYYEFS
ncbi:hypothetical protein JXJ21_12325 [candidate division KSB1 bacterium]|nr:hypothetical protein [candidate division KSB1 bacterium]